MHEPIAFPWQLGGGQAMQLHHNMTNPLTRNQTQAVGISGGETGFALRAGASHSGDKGDGGVNTNLAISRMAVRRLTPTECERLQGFPDGWTQIHYHNKSADNCPDGPRYKALGNSMAVPVMAWIGRRIAAVDAIT
jgi:site-specific DNA-cytosine methylase